MRWYSLLFFAALMLINFQRVEAKKLEILPLPQSKYTLAQTTYPKRSIWLGLYCNGKSCELKQVRLLARPTTVQSCYEGRLKGQILKIADGSHPVCLLRGLPNSTPRKLQTFYRPARNSRAAKSSQSFKITGEGGTTYRVLLRRSGTPPKMTYLLKKGKKIQQLESFEIDPVVGDDGLTRRDEVVVWAGDLDDDGKADFLTAITSRSGEALTMQLYLSRGAGKDKIVKPAVRFDYWPPENPGC